MSNVEDLNEYITRFLSYVNGEITEEEFAPIPIPKEVDMEMQRDSFY